MPKVNTGHILRKLRDLFDSTHTPTPIDGYIVYSNDAHMSEYTSAADQRRKFVSGFSGSAGTAIITKETACLWTDGRYYLAAEECLDNNWTLMKMGLPKTPIMEEWLKQLPSGYTIGTDPRLISYVEWKSLKKLLKNSDKMLIAINENLVDIVWKEYGKPMEALSIPYIYDVKYAGKSWQEKIGEIRKIMVQKAADVMVISSLDEIAWLLNLRGCDVEFCPVFKAFLILTLSGSYLCIDENRISKEVIFYLNSEELESGESVTIMPYTSVILTLKELSKKSKRVWINKHTPAALALEVQKDKLLIEINPVLVAKGVKNEIELGHLKRACIRDAACFCELFGNLQRLSNDDATCMNEISASNLLQSIRRQTKLYVMDSFRTISSVGPNCAIIHYSPSNATKRTIDNKNIYICDSGAQYLDGTTDFTRTVHFGKPSDYEKECYTLVLKGHIAMACAIFPRGTKGHHIDTLARVSLWKFGLDYLHGTGHGVGMFLNVHEGPQKISPNTEDYDLEPGNILSNEPGYYEDGMFGIRLENLLEVIQVQTKYDFKKMGFLGFKVVSQIPFHLNLINPDYLTDDEIEWINAYHNECVTLIQPELNNFNFKEGIKYLMENTKPITKSKK